MNPKLTKLLFTHEKNRAWWQEALLGCEAGGGSLLSLGRAGVESAVTQAVDVSDFWTGNISAWPRMVLAIPYFKWTSKSRGSP